MNKSLSRAKAQLIKFCKQKDSSVMLCIFFDVFRKNLGGGPLTKQTMSLMIKTIHKRSPGKLAGCLLIIKNKSEIKQELIHTITGGTCF